MGCCHFEMMQKQNESNVRNPMKLRKKWYMQLLANKNGTKNNKTAA